MDEKKVLIAFDSRFGSTEEISQEIAEILDQEEIVTTLVDLRQMSR